MGDERDGRVNGGSGKASGERSYSVRAAERVCDILDLLRAHPGGISLGEIAGALELPKSSVFRYLWTLESRHYVERVADDGQYQLGPAFLPLHARRSEILSRLARPRLERLRDTFEETVNLGVFDGTRVVYLEIVESAKSMRMSSRPGDRDPIHSTALGKAIAATLPEEQVREILEREGMPAFTDGTITDVETYLAELQRVREQGYAIDDRENEIGGRCVAVALPNTQPQLAMSLSAPASRLPAAHVPHVGQALVAVAEELAAELDHMRA